MSSPTPAFEPVRITVVDSEACHFCEDAHRALTALAANYPLAVDTVAVRSEAGQALMARHRAPMSPLVLLEGTFFSSGRLPRRKQVWRRTEHRRRGEGGQPWVTC
jgi:hypothetical protein